ncbi:MAG: hypothetical protein LBJ57_06820 [Prevotellaceae bacterium]|jgi:hypothetical protein|nr:hypothetical protein [Prevotellaceae bacterium]
MLKIYHAENLSSEKRTKVRIILQLHAARGRALVARACMRRCAQRLYLRGFLAQQLKKRPKNFSGIKKKCIFAHSSKQKQV